MPSLWTWYFESQRGYWSIDPCLLLNQRQVSRRPSESCLPVDFCIDHMHLIPFGLDFIFHSISRLWFGSFGPPWIHDQSSSHFDVPNDQDREGSMTSHVLTLMNQIVKTRRISWPVMFSYWWVKSVEGRGIQTSHVLILMYLLIKTNRVPWPVRFSPWWIKLSRQRGFHDQS